MSVLLEVGELTVRFRVKPVLRTLVDGADKAFIDAVANVSFTLGEGETMGLVGESGSGKTTLARAVIGLVRPAEGSIRFEGEEIAGLSDRAMKPVRRRMSMMFQDPVGSLSPRLTVRSLITEPYRIHGLSDRDRDAECRRLLGLVGLPPDFAARYPHQLSGGQARRVGVARALALDPKLILADEPTAGLDVSVQGEILNLLARLQDETGVSILMVTHNLNVVRHVTERVAIMYLGRFVETGPTDDIFRAPGTPTPPPCSRPIPNPIRTPGSGASNLPAIFPAFSTGLPGASSTRAASGSSQNAPTSPPAASPQAAAVSPATSRLTPMAAPTRRGGPSRSARGRSHKKACRGDGGGNVGGGRMDLRPRGNRGPPSAAPPCDQRVVPPPSRQASMAGVKKTVTRVATLSPPMIAVASWIQYWVDGAPK
jgi:ABC-type oligopeptide transport system ATPase subunit